MSEREGSSAASRGGRMRLSPCLMPWYASLVWVQLGCVCCITAMVVIFLVLLYWVLPRDEDSKRPFTFSRDAYQTSEPNPHVIKHLSNPTAKPISKPVSSNAKCAHNMTFPPTDNSPHSSNSRFHHPTSPPDPLPSTTTHESNAPPSTTMTCSRNRYTVSSAPSSLTITSRSRLNSVINSRKIQQSATDSQTRLSPVSQSTGVPVDENDKSETTFSGRSSSGTKHFSLSSASPEGGTSSSLIDLRSHIREMLSKVREIDMRFVGRDQVVVQRVEREDVIGEKQEEEELQ